MCDVLLARRRRAKESSSRVDDKLKKHIGHTSLLIYQSLRSFRFIDSLTGLRRHVVFIVLGEYRIRIKYAVRTDFSLRNAASTFLEQVRKDALVHNGNTRRRVGYRKVDGQAIVI